MEEPSEHADVFAGLRGFARSPEPRLQFAPTRHRRAAASPGLPSDAPVLREVTRNGQQASAPHGRCELCSLPLAELHRHLFESATKELVCACDGCAYTFQGVAGTRYKPVPRDARALDDAVASQIPWEQLSLPINLAFFVRDGDTGHVCGYYPSPGGVTKSNLPFDAFDDLFPGAALAENMEDDVEALLVNRLTQKTEAFIVPIDRCYELAGLIRIHWRGFSGGEDMRQEMEAFFNGIRSTAGPIRAGGGGPS